MQESVGFFVNGTRRGSGARYELRNPYDGAVIARVCRAGRADVEEAIAGAVEAFKGMRRLSTAERAELLRGIAVRIRGCGRELAESIVREAGKPIRLAEAEVERAACTFSLAAHELFRIAGELVPLDVLAGTRGRTGLVRRFPLGPVAGITPFNFPLNLVAHKVAPAIAVGAPIVVKPATQTPLCALRLAEISCEAGLEAGAFSAVTASARDAAPLVEDARIKKLSFTGSAAVGWELKRRCGAKGITLELGGNAACIVHEDADLDLAVPKCVSGGFAYQGQICIHLQRLFLHEHIYDRFRDAFVTRARALRMGDPMAPETDIGPMLREEDAARVESWVGEAEAGGARVLCGGRRRGAMFEPTVIENCDPRLRVSDEEVFGPVVVLFRYGDFEEAIRMANDSRYGLQAGVFTRDMHRVWTAFEELEVGGVMVNEAPTLRVDNQPYGGCKASGIGREGLRYAMDEMTEARVLVVEMH